MMREILGIHKMMGELDSQEADKIDPGFSKCYAEKRQNRSRGAYR